MTIDHGRPLRLGACLSLSGRHARFGTQAQLGLQIWQDLNGAHELIIEDDESKPEVLDGALRGLSARCDILLGPYSTQLMRRAGRVAADLDRLIWNHGGSGDDVEAAHPGHVVSVLTPTSRYAEPFIRHLADAERQIDLWIVQGKGGFGRQVAAGAEVIARSLGMQAVRMGPGEELPSAGTWALFCAGSFEEDVETVGRALAMTSPPKAICAVAAGVREFGDAITNPLGVYGVGQWFPGGGHHAKLGPAEADFLAAYRDRAGVLPDYPAAQAAAAAAIATRCAQVADSTARDDLWSVAAGLKSSTLFGPFEIDPHTGVQVAHRGTLVRWESGGPVAVPHSFG